MIALAHRAGIRVRAGLVYEKDSWKYFEDEYGQHFHWVPLLDVKNASERGRELFAFSVFTEANGVQQIHIMESYHIDQIKKLVLARMKGSSTPWSDPLFEPEMRKKTCIRRHSKTEPFSVELARAIEHEENDEAGKENKELLPELLEVFEAPAENQTMSTEEAAKLNKELDLQAAQESTIPLTGQAR
jgi:recombinational DNA repair protein RecT